MFKIETLKWEWPEGVEKKEIYRDDEFVRTKTKDEALEAIDFLHQEAKKLSNPRTYTITVFRDGEFLTYYRHTMPCLGGLVKYKVTHGDDHFMNAYFPRDIRVMFPEGNITFISHPLHEGIDLDSKYFKFILSEDSPWISAFGSQSTIVFKKDHFVLTNMNTDPTVFYSLLKLARFNGDSYGVAKQEKDARAVLLATFFRSCDPRRLAGQKPLKISGGTWAQGYGYTRPYNDFIFQTKIPLKREDFEKADRTAHLYQDKSIFLNAIKEQFGVNLNPDAANNADFLTKHEETLIKAWDYFKGKASELSDEPG